jgi:hypothetical protein
LKAPVFSKSVEIPLHKSLSKPKTIRKRCLSVVE